jgi:hypothetical protein
MLKVDVTEADIDLGDDRPASCPVALALTRALAGAGFPGYTAEWEPYNGIQDPRGLEVWRHDPAGRDRVPVARLPVADCPAEMYELASLFDDWYRADGDDPDAPERPAPASFSVELPLA